MDPYQGGLALELMITDSAADKTLVPTARQFKDLLAVLSGFADEVFGWQILLSRYPGRNDAYRDSLEDLEHRPNNDAVAKLVDALRQLNRIGDAASLTFQANVSIAWLAAFTKWSLGIPSSILLEDGTCILNQPSSRVKIVVGLPNARQTPQLQIVIYRDFENLVELILADMTGSQWVGMVTIESYGQWLLHRYQLSEGFAYRASLQLIPYAIKQALSLLHLVPGVQRGNPGRRLCQDLAMAAFPDESVVAETLRRLLDCDQNPDLPDLVEGVLTFDLPIWKLVEAEVKASCKCATCESRQILYATPVACKVQGLRANLVSIVVDALALCLFDQSQTLLIHPTKSTRHKYEGFWLGCQDILFEAKESRFPVREVLKRSLALVCHGESVLSDIYGCKWVMSCQKGQAVYPRISDTEDLAQPGYLTLSWAKGVLYDQERPFTRVCGHANNSAKGKSLLSSVTGPQDSESGYHIV